MFDILIKKGYIVDGGLRKAYIGDVGVKDGLIVAMGQGLAEEAQTVIEASGLVVTPGFIDVHSHNDLVACMGEELKSLKIKQGVTTELVGQCGLGVVPCVEPLNNSWKNYISGVVGNPDFKWQFGDMENYFQKIESFGMKNNLAALVSHGAIRSNVMGLSSEKANKEQIKAMVSILERALDMGAFGMSLGLQYMPGIFSDKTELIALCKKVAEYDGILMVHLRNHDISILRALDEMYEVADASKVKLHISHLRSYDSEVLGANAEKLIESIDHAVGKGIQVTFDEHLYLSGSTLMTQLLPPWMTAGGSQEMKMRLKDKAMLLRLRLELKDPSIHYEGWDNYSYITGWDGIMITSVKKDIHKSYQGRTVGAIALELGKDPLDFALELLMEEDFGVAIVTMDVFSEKDTIDLINHPLQMVGSDSIPAGNPHPRLYGNYPLFLGKYVRDLKALSLEEAVYKMTGMPAKTLNLKKTGTLEVGKIADITVFDFDNIRGYEDYFEPRKKPIGIEYVIVNGHIALEKGTVAEKSFGKILKK